MKKYLFLLFILLFIVATLCGTAFAQEDRKPILRLNRIDTTLYPTNFLNVTIIGKEGKSVDGLTAENFKVFEEGKEQKVLDVVQSDEKGMKLYIVLVIDTSGSMTPAIEDTKKAAEAFLTYLSPQDEVAVLSFANTYMLKCDFTSDREVLKSAIQSLQPNGGTALYAATYQALTMFDKVEDGNKAVIVLTDGQNNMMGSLQDCIDSSYEKGVPIFTIGLGSSVDQNSLDMMATQTGGMFKYAPDSTELEEIYKSLATQLKKQYWVKYVASPQRWPKSRVPDITVRLNKVEGGAGLESSLAFYIVPVQWWKIITGYVLIELVLIMLTYLLFRLFWGKMGMNPVTATRLSIFILIVLTIIWYCFVFFHFIPFLYFLLIALGQLVLLIIPIKMLAK